MNFPFKWMTIATALWLSWVSVATAQEPKTRAVEGRVVMVTSEEVIIDLGLEQGLAPQGSVEVYRHLQVVHPVTKESIEDRFPIGKAKLDKVGSKLSILKNVKGLERTPKPGDFVVFRRKMPAVKKALRTTGAVVRARPKTSGKAVADAGEEAARSQLEQAFRKTLGKTPEQRVEIWRTYLTAHPKTPYLEEIIVELAALREQIELTHKKAASGKTVATKQPKPEASYQAVLAAANSVPLGERPEIVAVIDEPRLIQAIQLMWRRPSEEDYRRLPMKRVGDHQWLQSLPADAPDDARRVEFFVEAVDRKGQHRAIAGSALRPRAMDYSEPVRDPAPIKDRSRARATGEFVDFKLGEGEDAFYRFEVDYRYGLDFGWVNAFSVGAGIFQGSSASVETIARGGASTPTALSYGFAEIEFGPLDWLGFSFRALVGNQQNLTGERFTNAFGARAELRIGEELGTRLLLGGALTQAIGNELWIAMPFEAIDRVPMEASVVVTNLPVGGDLGVSLGYSAGYRFTDLFSIQAKVGWNARTIAHQGPSVGTALQLDW